MTSTSLSTNLISSASTDTLRELSRRFPPDFRWGAATAAYQIEGAVDEDGRGKSIWDTYSHTEGRINNGDTGDVACDHYHRFEDDIALMADLGIRNYRFSVAWPRVLPDGEGRVNAAGLDFYSRLVDTLLAHGIRPLVTLYHWDLPEALHDKGGWGSRDTTQRFAEYAAIVARAIGDRVSDWVTHNEPWVTTVAGYMFGRNAPGITDPPLSHLVAHHLMLSHGLATQALRAERPGCSVGITLNLAPVRPASDSEADRRAARLQDAFLNRWFLDPVLRGSYPEDLPEALGWDLAVDEADLATMSQPIDFLGVNYYSPSRVVADPTKTPPARPLTLPGDRVTDMGWVVDGSGLTELLVRLAADYPGVPLMITENGAAYPDIVENLAVHDGDRVRYLTEHWAAIAAAVDEGVPLRGYYVWSLMDNFEWGQGYSKRFGIVHVDYETQVRTVKDSGLAYAALLQAMRGEAAGPGGG
ncbi:MAG: GH1 family beta-glucosidase [Acidimicrobiales bacterium]